MDEDVYLFVKELYGKIENSSGFHLQQTGIYHSRLYGYFNYSFTGYIFDGNRKYSVLSFDLDANYYKLRVSCSTNIYGVSGYILIVNNEEDSIILHDLKDIKSMVHLLEFGQSLFEETEYLLNEEYKSTLKTEQEFDKLKK